MTVCPSCGQETPEGFAYCGNCGAPLVTVEEAREERKVVSILFADLVGFTSKAERLDPEDVRATLSPYYARLRSELEHHGGTVEKFIGDAVMAVFGAPTAHEDDPERAVRAALAIREAMAEDGRLQVRIAVTTGEALVTLGARPSEGEGIAAGDVVNTAARLQSAAPVNGILVDETTYRATRDQIGYAEAEPVTAKGKAEPVPVWEATEARARFGVDVFQAGASLVGRQPELTVVYPAVLQSIQIGIFQAERRDVLQARRIAEATDLQHTVRPLERHDVGEAFDVQRRRRRDPHDPECRDLTPVLRVERPRDHLSAVETPDVCS